MEQKSQNKNSSRKSKKQLDRGVPKKINIKPNQFLKSDPDSSRLHPVFRNIFNHLTTEGIWKIH